MELDVNKVINELKKIIANKEYENCLLRVQVEEQAIAISDLQTQLLIEKGNDK